MRYKSVINNIGYGGVDSPKIIYLFPANTKIIEHEIVSSPIKIPYTEDTKTTDQGIEHSIKWERIEKTDNVVASFLLECQEPDSIKCNPRDLEGVECKIGQFVLQDELESKIRIIAVLFSMFILFGMAPILREILQAVIVILMIPHFLYIANALIRSLKNNEVSVKTSKFYVEKEGVLTVNQK